MKLYLVGGAVRDLCLGLQPKDFDFVAVGATAENILNRWPDAYPTGKAFPVYRIPNAIGNMECELALARREKKTSAGHNGFAVEFGPEVTLVEDLMRRDLTINSMAIPSDSLFTQNGMNDIIDPFNGLKDLNARILRHTSNAFQDDPLRVFRLARFAAKYGFDIAEETISECKKIPASEILSLSGERIGEEFYKAMDTSNPAGFFNALLACNGLHLWMPELATLRDIPAGPAEHHPEGDSLTHSLLTLDAAVRLGANRIERISALLHDVGKAVTPCCNWPNHHGHDSAGVPLAEAFCDRLRLTANDKKAAMLACEEHMRMHVFPQMRPGKQVDMIMRAKRNPLGTSGLALVAEADQNGRGRAWKAHKGAELMRRLAEAVRFTKMPVEGLTGLAAKNAIHHARIQTVKKLTNS